MLIVEIVIKVTFNICMYPMAHPRHIMELGAGGKITSGSVPASYGEATDLLPSIDIECDDTYFWYLFIKSS